MTNYTHGSKAAQLIATLQTAKENLSALKEVWEFYFEPPIPPDSQFKVWLGRPALYGDVDNIAAGIVTSAQWLCNQRYMLESLPEPTEEDIRLHTKGMEDVCRYASGCMIAAMRDGETTSDRWLKAKGMGAGRKYGGVTGEFENNDEG